MCTVRVLRSQMNDKLPFSMKVLIEINRVKDCCRDELHSFVIVFILFWILFGDSMQLHLPLGFFNFLCLFFGFRNEAPTTNWIRDKQTNFCFNHHKSSAWIKINWETNYAPFCFFLLTATSLGGYKWHNCYLVNPNWFANIQYLYQLNAFDQRWIGAEKMFHN